MPLPPGEVAAVRLTERVPSQSPSVTALPKGEPRGIFDSRCEKTTHFFFQTGSDKGLVFCYNSRVYNPGGIPHLPRRGRNKEGE